MEPAVLDAHCLPGICCTAAVAAHNWQLLVTSVCQVWRYLDCTGWPVASACSIPAGQLVAGLPTGY
jgi:hypothetical protein